MRNLFNKLKFYITNPIGKKQLLCKKNDFCDCSEDLSDLCLTCREQTAVNHIVCPNTPESPESPGCLFSIEGSSWILNNTTVVTNEPIDMMNPLNSFVVSSAVGVVEGYINYPIDTAIQFIPNHPFICDTLYTATVTIYGLDGCMDTIEYTFTFDCPESPEIPESPESPGCGFLITNTTPYNGSISVPVGIAISVEANADIDQINPLNVISMVDVFNNPISGSVSYPFSNTILFTPNVPLENSMDYNVNCALYGYDGCGDIVSFIFTTEADTPESPEIPESPESPEGCSFGYTSNPSNGSTVPITTAVQLLFNEDVDSMSGTFVFSIVDNVLNPVAGVGIRTSNSEYLFTPNTSLIPGIQYVVRVEATSTQTQCSINSEFSFTTPM